MEHIHARFGKCEISRITQGQLETWQDAVKGDTETPMAVFYGKCVRAAIKAGILLHPSITEEQVSEANPGEIHWLANCIADEIVEASRIDPLS